MAFFNSSPNLPGDDKARIEYHLQQLSECIGFKHFKLPVLTEASVLYGDNNRELHTVRQIMNLTGKHLGYDISNISIQTIPMPLEKSGGGG